MKTLILVLLYRHLKVRMKKVHVLRHLTAEDWKWLHDEGLYGKLPGQLLWVRSMPDPTLLQRLQRWVIRNLEVKGRHPV